MEFGKCKGECSLKGFLSVVGERIVEWESRKFKEGLDSKVNLSLTLHNNNNVGHHQSCITQCQC